MLANAVRGPSAGFSQDQAFLVLTEDDLARFWDVPNEAADTSVHTAPLVILPLSSKRIYLDRYARPDMAGPTGMRRAGPCRSGISTPGWPRC
jgi:hypothetical protein